MKNIKKIMIMSLMFAVYISAVTILLKFYYIYQEAYYGLSRLMSHTSVESVYEVED